MSRGELPAAALNNYAMGGALGLGCPSRSAECDWPMNADCDT